MEFAQKVRAAGFDLFDTERSGSAATRAEFNLRGRTHYYEPDTRRFHGSRCLMVRAFGQGLILGTLESTAADFEKTRRVFRPVFFNLNGETIERPGLDDSYKTRAAAEREFWRISNTLDCEAVTREMLRSMAKRAATNAAAYLSI